MTARQPPDAEQLAADQVLWAQIKDCLPLLADLSRSDVLLYAGDGAGPVTVIAQARPHSIAPIFTESLVGQTVVESANPALYRALRRGRPAQDAHQVTERAISSFQQVHPIRAGDRTLGALGIETNQPEYDRHRRRSAVFQEALAHVQQMALRGQLCADAALSPFGEHDGVVVINAEGLIQYVSGIAVNLYRKVGHSGRLVGTPIVNLPDEAELYRAVQASERCLEQEFADQGFIWVKKAIPIHAIGGAGRRWGRFLPGPAAGAGLWGILFTIHDATDERRKERELRIKSALIQEIHHRVKNNLQTIAALIRLQARRSNSEEVQQVLQTTISRILSIAVVHEFLAQGEGTPINMRGVAQQVLNQLNRSVVDSEQRIRLNLHGDDVYLPAQQATSCALVINELIQNALEHGFTDQASGTVTVCLYDQGDVMQVEVTDDGIGLPAGFDVQRDGSLGLHIVQTLVREDLKGNLELRDGHGVRATVTFPKAPLAQPVSPISDL